MTRSDSFDPLDGIAISASHAGFPARKMSMSFGETCAKEWSRFLFSPMRSLQRKAYLPLSLPILTMSKPEPCWRVSNYSTRASLVIPLEKRK